MATAHPWLRPTRSMVAKVAGRRATAALRQLATMPQHRFGERWPARQALLAALPTLLRADSGHVFTAVGGIDVLPVLLELGTGAVDPGRLERALVSLWLGLAGHPGLAAGLALPGPFRERVVDPRAPRLLALDDVRGLLATANGPVVVGRAGQVPLESLVVAPLAVIDGTVVIDECFAPPDAPVVARVQEALALVGTALPGGHLVRVTIGSGDATAGEARVGPEVEPADLVASAQAAFTRAATAVEPVLEPVGILVEKGCRVGPGDLLARASGQAVALPWGAARAGTVLHDLDDLAVVAELTPGGEALVGALRALAGTASTPRRRALLVNVDVDDFVYSFQFGRSVERRCVERGLCVDRIVIDGTTGRDLAGEIGSPIPVPIADGAEFHVASDNDPALARALRRVSTRRYEVVVANVRPRLFYDLAETELLTSPTLIWDRHLHDGLSQEHARRGSEAHGRVRQLPIRLWSLLGGSGEELTRGNAALIEAGLEPVAVRPWPMDIEFFHSTVSCQPDRLFAGGDSRRDWPLLMEAIRDLPLDVHLVTAEAPADLPPRVHVDRRLTLCRFRDAMAAAAVTAIPLAPGGGASGLTVLTMAMALGVAVVATASPWMVHYVTDGEEALLVPPGDAAALRDALVRLYAEPDLRARLVANARRRVEAQCDLEAFTREMFATVDQPQ